MNSIIDFLAPFLENSEFFNNVFGYTLFVGSIVFGYVLKKFFWG